MFTPSAMVRWPRIMAGAADGAVRADVGAAGDADAAGHGGVAADAARCGRPGSGCRASRRPRSRCRPARRGRCRYWRRFRRRRRCAPRRAARSFPSRALVGAKPKPSAPITTPGCSVQRSPITQSSPTNTRALSTVPAPMRRRAPPRTAGRCARRRPTPPRVDHGAGMDALTRGGACARFHSCVSAGEVEIGVVGDDAGAARLRRLAHGRRHDDAAGREASSCCR
jgi:hypothetical protein